MLEKAGVQLLSAPSDLPGGDAGEGNRCLYARAPCGSTVELVTYPSPQAYESRTSLRRWHPPSGSDSRRSSTLHTFSRRRSLPSDKFLRNVRMGPDDVPAYPDPGDQDAHTVVRRSR